MDFPQFQVPALGHGMTIGLNAVIHVILSHGIAIGVFFFITLCEWIGYRRRSPSWDHFAHDAIIPTAIIISSFSAITGVGIWFTIGTLDPRAAAAMLRLFFWPWFLEWIDFVLEVVLLLIYYELWSKMETTPQLKRRHVIIGFSYVGAALVSAFLITGIIGYQLTPGQWPWNQSRWAAFYNPSLWPQTLLRFFGGIAVGAIFISAFAAFRRRYSEVRAELQRVFGLGLLVSGGITALCYGWYRSEIPEAFKINTVFSITTSHFSQHLGQYQIALYLALGMVGLLVLVNLLGSKWAGRIVVFPALIAAFAMVAGFERMREFIRGPYTMTSYLYTSELTQKEVALFRRDGLLTRLYWHNASSESPTGPEGPGQTMFDHACSTCHTRGGLNDIRQRLTSRSEDGIYAILGHTRDMVPWMPPFPGTDAERRVFAGYLYRQTRQWEAQQKGASK